MGLLLLRLRAAPQGQVADGEESIAPGIGGSAVATATGPVDDSGLALDPNQSTVSGPTFPISLTGASSSDTLSTTSPTVAPSPSPSASNKSSSSTNNTTIIIASVAAAAFLLIGAATLILFCRSTKRTKRRQSGRGQWREIDSHQSQPGMHHGQSYPPEADGKAVPPSQAMFQSETKSMYSTRRSTDAPPSLHLEFNAEPLMTNNSFASSPSPSSSSVPPVPAMPTLYNVQQPQLITVEHPVEPPSAGFTAPSEYTASYIRSVYSTTGDAHSIADSHGTGRSRSNTLKRGPDRTKNNQELIALDNLIMALDFKEEKQSDGERQDLPDPSLFRAALSGGGPAPSQHGY
ncbi:hypothetical protein BKA62DRAFT_686407 [Auriculariales sp. MPI-PUGE-AT-0066]|nr:hypothetical protein BKA62DRAFT_686407 [Auriculariales sp. MPI-PUGE-AT-0066]